jgi:hypothetical protein
MHEGVRLSKMSVPVYQTTQCQSLEDHNDDSQLHDQFIFYILWARGSLVVKMLGYKPEAREFETRWGDILNLPNPSGHTRP